MKVEDNNENPLATELLFEIKTSAKRWFIAFVIMIILEICTIIGFLWYISLPIEDYNVEQHSDNSSRNLIIGGDNYDEPEGQL